MRKLYYRIKPIIPRRLQVILRRWLLRGKLIFCHETWPIDWRAGTPPPSWRGWPGGKRFALTLTHDVETAQGVEACSALMTLEERHGFRSSFNFVAKDYPVDPVLRHRLADRGFEIGIHGLSHDGNLYKSREYFRSQAGEINRYLKEWGAVGFRSPAMHHNLKWLHDLSIEYDASTFDTDPFEPQPDGVGTVFPFFATGTKGRAGYVELPYTLPQDFTLFVLMKERSIDIWKRKLDWIAECGGMALLITHPDYMVFDGRKPRYDQYPAKMYEAFLEYVRSEYADLYWHGLPKEMARFWADGSVTEGDGKEWPEMLPHMFEKKTNLTRVRCP